jgi:hypothetical protein
VLMHFCECGHQPSDHHMDFGACQAEEETLWGPEGCTCPKYEFQGDS